MTPDEASESGGAFRRVVDSLGGPWAWLVVALFAVVAVSIHLAVTPTASRPVGARSTSTTAAVPTPTTTTVTTITTDPTTTTTTDAPATTTTTVAAAEDSGVWLMPDAVGRTLSDAKDEIATITEGVEVPVRVHDDTGKGRSPIIHQNWMICTQDPLPGTKFTPESGIDFGIVKTSEACPDNGT